MSNQKPVVVYAASGYTGRLVCEALAQLGVPFVAAGRNAERLAEVVHTLRQRGADCTSRAVEHSPAGLSALLSGSRVVINTSGPFSALGHAVVDAALAEGVHYLDITGEQDFMFDLRRDYGERFLRQKLLLSPSASFLWAPGAAAAELCLQHEGVDRLSVTYAPPSLQTVASLQSMIRSARRGGYCIVDGRLATIPPSDVREVLLPSGETRRGLRIGAGETTFFQGDPRVLFCDTIFTSNDLARIAPVFGAWQRLSQLASGERLDSLSDTLVLRLKQDPPAEDPATQGFVVRVVGEGQGQTVRVILDGNSPYISTGFLAAMAAESLLDGKAQRWGYASLGQAFGASYVLERMQAIGCRTQLEVSAAKAPKSALREVHA